ncbi:MAG: phenylalanine--tRNA ligase subunit beta, partial [Clostridia bacterium]|nr:phenylalanine--tRNA ligase subunit beta [Clostridia bacterium]
KLFGLANKEIYVKPFSKFPVVERDIALVCDRSLTNGEILAAISSARVKTLVDVKLFDVYTGDKIAEDKKSLAYRLTFSSDEKTFDVDEVDNFVRKILVKLEAIGAKLR